MEQPNRVVVVEDDPTVRGAVGDYLGRHGYVVDTFGDGVSARDHLHASLPDLVIVDRMLPGISGDELCRDIRSRSDVPIMMLTALGEVEQRIEGLESGADDYVPKPFALRELLLRADALVRRTKAAPAPAAFAAGDFEIDAARRRARVRGDEISLTGREYELLVFLVGNPDRTLAREEILREVWGWTVGDASTVTVHVRRLREKIERDPREPRYLHTEWGAGYRFSVTGSAD
ncbi:response regulator transcription factor [Microbacterium sp. KUDC0406]|uniref:response regulator transcription factor n=1 Tax=Microbacterium sp. KUDC0406 TaxID=2909588 RepID=UPI001F1E646F|nr:response regulator transcription factor [Microbacterium sp. KUDC0406]UJP09855.1 response regulator transcription factor [Microbacterium sp. KUDC0406]